MDENKEIQNVEFETTDNNTDQNNKGDMPSKGLYTFLLVLGFLLGLIWGALSISPYQNMKKAIDAGNSAEAWEHAGKIKRWILIGVAVNVVLIVLRSCTGV